jgi:hypothetical protein
MDAWKEHLAPNVCDAQFWRHFMKPGAEMDTEPPMSAAAHGFDSDIGSVWLVSRNKVRHHLSNPIPISKLRLSAWRVASNVHDAKPYQFRVGKILSTTS